MTINSLKDGECGIITHLNVDDKVLDRVLSFGIMKDKQIKRVKSTLGGSTILVELDRNCIALRAEEAESIAIKRAEV